MKPLAPGSLGLALDEDQLGDGERAHTTEQVAYLVVSEPAYAVMTLAE